MSRKAATEDKPKGRGGKRDGAGRKRAREEAVTTSSISLTPSGWDMLDAQRGQASRSEWIFGLILKEDAPRISN